MTSMREQRILRDSPAFYGLRTFIILAYLYESPEVFVVNAKSLGEAEGFVRANLGKTHEDYTIRGREFNPAADGIHPNAQAVQLRWEPMPEG